MIEAIARAAWDSPRENGYDVFERWDKLSDKGRQVVIDRVRAVLKALETPTPEMVEAGVAERDADRWPRITKAEKAEDAFVAMLRAAQE